MEMNFTIQRSIGGARPITSASAPNAASETVHPLRMGLKTAIRFVQRLGPIVPALMLYLFGFQCTASAQCTPFAVGEYNVQFDWQGSAPWAAANGGGYIILVELNKGCPPPTVTLTQPPNPIVTIGGIYMDDTNAPSYQDFYWIPLTIGVNPYQSYEIGTITLQEGSTSNPAQSCESFTGNDPNPCYITVGDGPNPGCSYTVTATSPTGYGAQGGTGGFLVNAIPSGVSLSACTWSAVSGDSWITNVSPSSSTGDGSVTYSVSPSAVGSQSGIIVIAGQTFTILEGSPCAASTALVDPVPALLNGASVSTSPTVLSSGGTPVQGVAADGVAELLVRIPVTDPHGNCPTLSATLSGGTNSTDEGSVQMIDGGTVDPSTKMAFALYTAPSDYVTVNNPGDASTPQRTVSLSITASGQQIANQTITIIRPLVVMIHGLWDNASSWFTLDQGASTQRFTQVRLSFNGTIPLLSGTPCPSATSTSTVPCALPLTTDGNALGLVYAAQVVEPQISQDMTAFRAGNNVAALPVAAVRADFLGHSMGGLVARQLALMPSFKANSNFGQGYIHKLITIGTPHLGSPLPSQIITDANTCVRNVFQSIGNGAYTSVTTTAGTFAGAMADLGAPGNGTDLTNAISALQNNPLLVPTAVIAGDMNSAQAAGINGSAAEVLLAVRCLDPSTGTLPPLVSNFNSVGWTDQVMGGASDGIVPLLSQLDGQVSSTNTFAAIHSRGALWLGFGGPYELQNAFDILDPLSGSTSGIAADVATLLNTPVSDNVLFTLIP